MHALTRALHRLKGVPYKDGSAWACSALPSVNTSTGTRIANGGTRDPPVSYLFRFGFRWAFDRKNGQQLSAERDIIESEVGKLPLSLYRVWITETPRRGTTTSQAARNPEKPQGVVRLYSSLARLPL